jgi:hypothetical protein
MMAVRPDDGGMAADFAIADLLAEAGYDTPEAQGVARDALEGEGLTRPGKARMAGEKRERALAVLDERFVRACAAGACQALAAREAGGRAVVEVGAERCPHCRGSDNRRAVAELARRLPAAGVRRLLVLGGTPVLHETMAKLLKASGGGLEVRYIDATAAVHTRDDAAVARRWADAIAVWSSTPLPHKVSTLYTDQPGAKDGVRIVTVTQRGIAGLCAQVLAALEPGGRRG